MNRNQNRNPWVRHWVVGVALISAATIQPAHAQDLEDSIDAELDDAIGVSAPPAKKSDSSAAAKKPAPTPTPAPTKSAQSKDVYEDDLQLDEGDDFGDESQTVENVDDLDGLELETGDNPPPKKAAKSPEPPAKPEPQVSTEPEPEVAPEVEPPQIAEPQISETPSYADSGSGGFGDEPNLAFESRLHRIFQKAKPVSEEKWSELIGRRRTEVYGVQAGDTLWDISQTFFGDGMFWSKLWAENGTIENPHRIVPGKGIRFVAGTESDAPSLNVTDSIVVASNELVLGNASRETQADAPVYRDDVTDLTDEEIQAGAVIEDSEVIPKPEIPPAGKPSKILKELPRSFVSQKLKYSGQFDSTGLDAPKPRVLTTPAAVIPNSYLSEGEPNSIGKIEEIELGERFASLGQNVFLKLDRSASVGQKLYVVFPKDKISVPSRGSVGPVVEIGGVIEVTEALNQDKNLYKATVVDTVNPIRNGSLVTTEPPPRVNYGRTGPRKDVEVRVIGGEFDETRKLLGDSSVIYLDGGSDAGLQPGDLLTVQSRRAERRESTRYPEVMRPIALIKVVKAMSKVATAVVLESLDEIRPGDRTGGNFPSASKGGQRRAEAPSSGEDELDF